MLRTTDQVLARWDVDGSLATDTRIDHRHGGRGHLDERHSAHVRRRNESYQIADDTTSERDHTGVAVAAVRELRNGRASRSGKVQRRAAHHRQR
jgi:hypothetical protein